MTAKLIEGAPIAAAIKERVRGQVAGLPVPPRLVSILASGDAGARFYARSQRKACDEVGIGFDLRELGPEASADELRQAVQALNADESVSSIFLLVPVADGVDARQIQLCIAPDKDVEGMHPANIGRLFYGDFSLAPCTPRAAITMLQEAGVALEGKETVVVGHSEIVGKPTVVMLLKSLMHAPTVTCCHIATRDLASHTSRADVLIVAAGKAGLITGDMVKDGCVVIDVGINAVTVRQGGKKKRRTVGDVDFDSVSAKAALITPVPGGVGAVTSALLLQNVAECARRQQAAR
jgi:methylenetetrahydrofolate dehydrogenase (NADP+)/methenyltetrahydrofolate cyclohydrolase